MSLQSLLVVCIVSACFVYAANQLLPLLVRQTLALALLRWPLPVFLARDLKKVTLASSGCGCDGCDRSPTRQVLPGTAKKSVERILVFHPALRQTPAPPLPDRP